MDNLDRTLREDAAKINVEVSAQLDDRIRASLENVSPMPPEKTAPRRRPVSLWWASSLTGVAAAIGIIALINVFGSAPDSNSIDTSVAASSGANVAPVVLPELSAHTAMLAGPLEQELENLESDLMKARDVVRRDLRLDL